MLTPNVGKFIVYRAAQFWDLAGKPEIKKA
jgi:hypothetical protein